MAKLLTGREVAEGIHQEMCSKITELHKKGISPTMAVVRVGEKPDDIAYESSIIRKAAVWGVEIVSRTVSEKSSEEEMKELLQQLNQEDSIHGVLLFQPFPKGIRKDVLEKCLSGKKDLDGFTTDSMNRIYSGGGFGYAPCTAEAVMELLKYYEIPISGKKAVVLGRSLVIGKPVSLMLLQENATLTIVHSKTENLREELRKADIIVSAVGIPKVVEAHCVRSGQTVIDVGINMSDRGQIVGDVDFPEVEKIVDAITPVPGGVGVITTAVLMKHLVNRAWEQTQSL